MQGFEAVLTWLALAGICGGAFAVYAVLFTRQIRRFVRSMIRLRDRIDRPDDRLR